ncbi:MAG TPA: VIT1/CCC1 transporter family protein [Geminicoccaceae bacterium]|nr:VIT1/CCC1 transporter family protein [Geminicoccaceae bacterium]
MEHEHSRSAIADRLARAPTVSYLRDWVYGGIDGAVTTFAVVAGVVGAELTNRVVLILGAANLVADGFSMAASNYSGTKTEHEELAQLRAVEERHIDTVPEGEREEIRQIFRAKGFEGRDLEQAVAVITGDRARWVDTMLAEEYGLPKTVRAPLKAAASTFAAFLLCGTIPLLPFLAPTARQFEQSVAVTALVFFLIGSTKSRWSPVSWWRSGAETLLIGLGAAALAYLVGALLRSVVV